MRVRAWPLRSGVIFSGSRSGSSRLPTNKTMATATATNGIPTGANSKKLKPASPASTAASETRMWIGVPVRASCEPAWAPNARGINSFDAGISSRTATSTTIGNRAATEPLTPIRAVNNATINIITTMRRVWLSPALATIH